MTNVFTTPDKGILKARLFQCAEEALKREGWAVERIAGTGKASVRRITKGNIKKTVSIRTTQDRWIAFPRSDDDKTWATLSDVDYVVAASVDDRSNPQFAQVHLLPASEVRSRFDRAYIARKKAGYVIPIGRGVWVSLYEKEKKEPVTFVGAGVGLDHPPIAKMALSDSASHSLPADRVSAGVGAIAEDPLTIAEAKRRLAASLGVAETAITITISS